MSEEDNACKSYQGYQGAWHMVCPPRQEANVTSQSISRDRLGGMLVGLGVGE